MPPTLLRTIPSARTHSGSPSGPSPSAPAPPTKTSTRPQGWLETGRRPRDVRRHHQLTGERHRRAFRDNLALEDTIAYPKALGALDRASTDRIMMEARLAAISPRDGDQHPQDLTLAIRQAACTPARPGGSSSRPGRPPPREPWRTGWCPSTRRTSWRSTPATSP